MTSEDLSVSIKIEPNDEGIHVADREESTWNKETEEDKMTSEDLGVSIKTEPNDEGTTDREESTWNKETEEDKMTSEDLGVSIKTEPNDEGTADREESTWNKETEEDKMTSEEDAAECTSVGEEKASELGIDKEIDRMNFIGDFPLRRKLLEPAKQSANQKRSIQCLQTCEVAMKTAEINFDVEYKCRECGKSNRNVNELKEHIERRHIPRLFYCKYCKVYKSHRGRDVRRHVEKCVYRRESGEKWEPPKMTDVSETIREQEASPGGMRSKAKQSDRRRKRIPECGNDDSRRAKKVKDGTLSREQERTVSPPKVQCHPRVAELLDLDESSSESEAEVEVKKAITEAKNREGLTKEKEVRCFKLQKGMSLKVTTKRLFYPDGRVIEVVERRMKNN